ncbi:TetR/AcrR family transcriptional regulator [Streptomyces tubercidicus]|uniref:HTH-type transcriptional regulator PksA n=1 Tax=Streptomyces tubercidicus TaxID=47759 RepID=A0A640USU0_9ACTN|nr:TetR/AcrR family transcriptional regulator [Streptomyces tubercidicus]WAU13586.1 TetR/AcrR family transcriptional regulator [Streptomyces tubercidicus]GFE39208.1 HTH-type transcriptional regulator PksA [Streptomyces tubercidicus]
MPKIVDPEARRRAVAQAVLRVVGRQGVEGASLRNVADEAGLAIGSVRHYFSDHDEVLLFAMAELNARIEGRVRGHVERLLDPGAGAERRARVEELLVEFLPLDAERREEGMLWQAFTTAARTRPGLRPYAVALESGLRALLLRVLRGSQEAGGLPDDLDLELETLRLSALLDGLTLQATLEPERITPDVLRGALRRHLETLRRDG